MGCTEWAYMLYSINTLGMYVKEGACHMLCHMTSTQLMMQLGQYLMSEEVLK